MTWTFILSIAFPISLLAYVICIPSEVVYMYHWMYFDFSWICFYVYLRTNSWFVSKDTKHILLELYGIPLYFNRQIYKLCAGMSNHWLWNTNWEFISSWSYETDFENTMLFDWKLVSLFVDRVYIYICNSTNSTYHIHYT